MRLTRVLPAAALLLAGALVPAAAGAQPVVPLDSVRDDRGFSFYARGPYRPGVPRPDSILGYDIGTHHTQYASQQRALDAIANAATDRVRVEHIATTPELRAMRIFIVSAPENIARLDQIRADLDRLADPRGLSQAELDALTARTPAVVWFSGSVHGDEVPGFEASMPLLYQLAASEEPATLEALRRTIVVINPSANPDGHERFAAWYNSVAVGSPDPQSIEHQYAQPWSIRGRFNHYRLNLNRDVFASTQREVQGMLRGMLRWHPMVVADLHGYTVQFFFAPAARPINVNIGQQAVSWLDAIGRANAEAFDRFGWGYYVRDQFDLYYPGYWDTWPSLTGAIGMTYETDGGPALLRRRDDGTLLSLRDGIAKHWVASMSTLETTAARARDRVRDYARFRQAAVNEGRTGALRRVVFAPGDDPVRAAELAATLLRQGIEVRRATAPFSVARARGYGDGRASTRRFDAGAYVVDLAQPQGRLARTLFEEDPELDPVFARTQIDKYRRNIRRGKGEQPEYYEFYDVTAWTLPVAFGVEAYMTDDAGAVPGEALSLPPADPSPAGLRAPERLPVDLGGGVTGERRARVAYLFPAAGSGSARLAHLLLADGYRVAVAAQPIEAGGRQWARGSFIVRVGRNDSTVHARIDVLAREAGVTVTGISSGYTETAQYGIYSEPTVSLTRPNVAILADEGVSFEGYGAIWWSFERRYGIPFTPISIGTLGNGDLARYNVIILPSASPGALQSRLGTSGIERLKTWVRNGGTLVTMGGATAWAARENVALTSARLVGSDDKADTTGTGAESADSARARRQAEQTSDRAVDALESLGPLRSPTASNASPQPVPGSHFDVALDRTHWLTFGYERPRLTVMVEGSNFLKLSREGSNVAVFPTSGTLHRGGFVWPDNTERLLRGTAFLIDEPLGDGHVVLFQNEPMFRGWWRALDRMVLNAVLLGPTF